MTDCDITALARKQKKQREPLGLAETAEAIPASEVSAVPSSGGGGISSPLTEQAFTGDTYYQLTSSDGLFVFEFANFTDYIDGDSQAVTVVHLDPDA